MKNILRRNVRQVTYLREVVLHANAQHITYLREFFIRPDKIQWGLVKEPVTPKPASASASMSSPPSVPYKRYEDEMINPKPVPCDRHPIATHHRMGLSSPYWDDDDEWDIEWIRRNGGL